MAPENGQSQSERGDVAVLVEFLKTSQGYDLASRVVALIKEQQSVGRDSEQKSEIKEKRLIRSGLISTMIAAIATVSAGLGAQFIVASAGVESKRVELARSEAYKNYSDFVRAMDDYIEVQEDKVWKEAGRTFETKYWLLEALLRAEDRKLAAEHYGAIYCGAHAERKLAHQVASRCAKYKKPDVRNYEDKLRQLFADRLFLK